MGGFMKAGQELLDTTLSLWIVLLVLLGGAGVFLGGCCLELWVQQRRARRWRNRNAKN